VLSIGLTAAVILAAFAAWELALLGGWDAAALTFLLTVWPIIARANGFHTEHLATREDETRSTASLLLVSASTSLFGWDSPSTPKTSGGQVLLISVTV
jgi:uncharacterized membrane protein